MKIADYGKAITSYIQAPTRDQKELLKARAEEADRTLLSDGTPPPKKPKQLRDLYNSIDTAVLGVRSNTIAPEFILPDLETETQQYIKDGLISGEDARKFAIERKEYWDKWIEENPGGTTPNFEFDNEGKSRILSQEEIIERINEADGGRIGFNEGTKTKLVQFVENFKTTTGKTPVSGFSKAKKQLDKISGVTDWRLHDLRRTFATVATETLGYEPVVVDRVLNHVNGSVKGIAAVYQKGQYLEKRKIVLDAWADYVQSPS